MQPLTEQVSASSAHTAPALLSLDVTLFALWLGGLVTIGAVVAPTAFYSIHHAFGIQLTADQQNTLAGSVVGASLRIYNIIAAVCGCWLASRLWLLADSSRIQAGPTAIHPFWMTSPAALALFLTATQALVLFPAISGAQLAGNQIAFTRLHHTYELLADVQLILLLAVAVNYGRLLSGKISP